MVHDFQRQKIDVICQHTKEGEIIPMRIRLNDEDGMVQTYKIYSYRNMTGSDYRMNIWIFECKILVLNTLKLIKLYYHGGDRIWTIDK